jgi:hypothetical protein
MAATATSTATAAPHPFADPESALHCGEHPSADEECRRERRDRAGRIGKQ